MRALVSFALLLVVLTLSGLAGAHGMRTGALRVDVISKTRALVRWTTTVPEARVRPVLPERCKAVEDDKDGATPTSSIWLLDCPGGIEGEELRVLGLGPVISDATIFVRLPGGTSVSHVLTAETPSWKVPAKESSLVVAESYVRSGLVHIATGADHLLFLVLLVLTLRRPRAVLLAETAFTLSHSFSFAATALGLVRVPAAPAEACIALSLVLLALDAGRVEETGAWRGAAAAFVFGLVHGLGFAGGLRELGLPDTHAAVALVGFGVGVEVGQVAFLGLVLAGMALVQRASWHRRFVAVAATAIGGLATAWLLERSLAVLSA